MSTITHNPVTGLEITPARSHSGLPPNPCFWCIPSPEWPPFVGKLPIQRGPLHRPSGLRSLSWYWKWLHATELWTWGRPETATFGEAPWTVTCPKVPLLCFPSLPVLLTYASGRSPAVGKLCDGLSTNPKAYVLLAGVGLHVSALAEPHPCNVMGNPLVIPISIFPVFHCNRTPTRP